MKRRTAIAMVVLMAGAWALGAAAPAASEAPPGAAEWEKGKQHALAICVSRCRNAPVAEIKSAHVAWQKIGAFLTTPSGLGPRVRRRTHYDKTILWNMFAKRSDIEAALRKIAGKVRPEDSLLVFFAGHSVVVGGKTYLVPYDAKASVKDSCIPLSELTLTLNEMDVRQRVVILDVGHEGAAADEAGQLNATGKPQAPSEEELKQLQKPGLFLLTACQPGEARMAESPDHVGYFVKHLHDALDGKADGPPPDGYVTASEAAAYVLSAVNAEAVAKHPGKTQRPLTGGKPAKTFFLSACELPRTGILHVKVRPAGATLSVDGKEVALSPERDYKQEPIAAGKHQIKATQAGRTLADTTALVRAGRKTTVIIPEPPPEGTPTGALQVRGIWSGAELAVDGEKQDLDGARELTMAPIAAGDHTVRVTKPGIKPFQAAAAVRAGETTVVTVGPEQPEGVVPTPGDTGVLIVKVREPGATLKVDGKDVELSPAGEYKADPIAAGDHKVQATKAGKTIADTTVTVRKDRTTILIIAAVPEDKPLGALHVKFFAPGDRLFLDGAEVDLGNADQIKFDPIVAGKHTVVVTRGGKKIVDVTETIAEGDTALVLVPPPAETGALHIRVLVADAKLAVDGKEVPLDAAREYRNDAIAPGDHKVQATKAGRTIADTTATVRPGQTTELTIAEDVQPDDRGALHVRYFVPGDKLFLDDAEVPLRGADQMKFDPIKVGVHKVRVTRRDRAIVDETVAIRKGQTTVVLVPPPPPPIPVERTGALHGKVLTPGAKVDLDGVPVRLDENNEFRKDPIKVGPHTLRIAKGAKEKTVTAQVRPGQTTEVVLSLPEGDSGALHVTVAPGGATVELDGRPVAFEGTDFKVDPIAAGDHTLKASKDGYFPAEKTVAVKAGETTYALLDLKPRAGALRIKALDPAVQVLLDGKAVALVGGEYEEKPIAAGPHAVQAIKGAKQKTIEAVVRPGETTTVFIPEFGADPVPRTSSLHVLVLVPGVKLSLDGTAIDLGAGNEVTIDPIAPGEHAVQATKGDQTKTFTVNIPPGKRHELIIDERVFTTPTARLASLHVRLRPPGIPVQAWLDGREIPVREGEFTVDPIAPGAHTIRAASPGYQTGEKTLAIEPGQRTTLTITLVDVDPGPGPGPGPGPAPPGALIVTTQPQGATVFVDGMRIGEAGAEGIKIDPLAAGAHIVKAAKEGFEAAGKPANVESGKTARVHIELPPPAQPLGTLEIAARPPGTTVLVDGRPAGVSADAPIKLEGVVPGPHTVQASKDGYNPQEKPAVVRPNETTQVAIELEALPPGALEVTVKPVDAKAWLDGEAIMLDPAGEFKKDNVTAGKHTVRVAREPAYAPTEQAVTVQSGKTTKLVVELERSKGAIKILAAAAQRGAEVWVDGRKVGVITGAVFEYAPVPTGDHAVKVAKDGATLAEKTVTVKRNETTEVSIAP